MLPAALLMLFEGVTTLESPIKRNINLDIRTALKIATPFNDKQSFPPLASPMIQSLLRRERASTE